MDLVNELERLRTKFHERALRRFDEMEGADHPDFFIYNGEMNAWREAAEAVALVIVKVREKRPRRNLVGGIIFKLLFLIFWVILIVEVVRMFLK